MVLVARDDPPAWFKIRFCWNDAHGSHTAAVERECF